MMNTLLLVNGCTYYGLTRLKRF